MERKRYNLPDTIRGVVLISMMVYHACWNMVYIYGFDWKWYKSPAAFIWQQSICWTFILLSGFCFGLGKHHLKSGILVFGGGLAVSIVTLIAMPQNRVVFGVLTCIGSCILIMTVLEKYVRKVRAEWGVIISFFLFLLLKNINSGSLGIGKLCIIDLPENWYQNYITTYLGFPFKGFYSTDYFSFIPWLFLFITGFYLYLNFEKYGWLYKKFMQKKLSVLAFLGRHSLVIYLIHQPVIYGLQEIFFIIF